MRDLCSEGPSPAFSTPPAQLERQTLGRRMGCVVCSMLVGPSAGFLAAIQIIHRNQACKTRSHPLLVWGRVWDGRQAGNGSWPGERRNQLEPFLAPPDRVHSRPSFPGSRMECAGSASTAGLGIWCRGAPLTGRSRQGGSAGNCRDTHLDPGTGIMGRWARAG